METLILAIGSDGDIDLTKKNKCNVNKKITYFKVNKLIEVNKQQETNYFKEEVSTDGTKSK